MSEITYGRVGGGRYQRKALPVTARDDTILCGRGLIDDTFTESVGRLTGPVKSIIGDGPGASVNQG